MTVIDASALLSWFLREPGHVEVRAILGQGATLSAINAAEVADVLVRVHAQDPDQVVADMELLAGAGRLMLEPVSAAVGLQAARLRAEHYRRQESPVSLADCVAAATAIALDRPLATSDRHLANLMRAEKGTVHPLPNSTGRLP